MFHRPFRSWSPSAAAFLPLPRYHRATMEEVHMAHTQKAGRNAGSDGTGLVDHHVLGRMASAAGWDDTLGRYRVSSVGDALGRHTLGR